MRVIANKILREFWEKHSDSEEGDEAEILTILIEKYEDEHYPIEAIKFRMEQMGMTKSDFAKVIGYPSRVTEILRRKR